MKRFDDEKVECPFYDHHKMPKQRLQWHVPKCEAKFRKECPHVEVFHCKYNYLHIYFEKDVLESHED